MAGLLRLLILAGVVGTLALPIVGVGAASGSETSRPSGTYWFPGVIGFVTHDGNFFIQMGYAQYIFGEFVPVYNNSQIYAYAVAINVSSIVSAPETASIKLYSYASKTTLDNLSIPVCAFCTNIVYVTLPTSHNWSEYRVGVDGTFGWFQGRTPYTFLSLTGIWDGGIDLAVFVTFAIFVVMGYPMMLKAERMTRKAIYAPRWRAIIWLHGIFIGMIGLYIIDWPALNQFFQGWEFVLFPIPEAIFIAAYTSGRHSTNVRAEFMQIVPRPGQRMGIISRIYYIGRDADGDLVIIRESRSVFQYLYRAWGHHVKVFRRSEAGALEPFPVDAVEQRLLSTEQSADPARFPRGAKYDAHDDFPGIDVSDDEFAPIQRYYFVKRISDLSKITWPYATIHRTIPEHQEWDGALNQTVTIPAKKRLCWPYIVDGTADVALCSWHYMDVLRAAMGYITVYDMVEEIDSLGMRLHAERGSKFTEASRMAEERLGADEDLRSRPHRVLTEEELTASVAPKRAPRRERHTGPDPEEGSSA